MVPSFIHRFEGEAPRGDRSRPPTGLNLNRGVRPQEGAAERAERERAPCARIEE